MKFMQRSDYSKIDYFTLFFYYSMDFITFIVVQQSPQPNFIAFPSQTLMYPPTPQPVSFENHKFFKVCESLSALQGSSKVSILEQHQSIPPNIHPLLTTILFYLTSLSFQGHTHSIWKFPG